MNYFNYFSEIEELFVRKRGKNLLLSPLDWALIESWKERGVPLPIALRAIEIVFEKAESEPAKKRSIKSLLYCRDEVERQYEDWLALQIGTTEPEKSEKSEIKQEDFPASQGEISAHLQIVVERLQKPVVNLNHNWQKIVAEVLAKLNEEKRKFHQTADLEKLEIALDELDHKIDDALLESFPPEKRLEIEKETAAQLRSYRNRMTEAVYRQTIRTLLLKALREQAQIPRLSLFYL